MKKISDKQKKVLCFFILGIIFILMCNNNNIPETFIERIIRPIKSKNEIFSIGGVVILLSVYYVLKYINLIEENRLIKTRFRRVVITILLVNIASRVSAYPAQIFKGFLKNLNSIYLYREDSSLEFHADSMGKELNGFIKIKNCGDNVQEFYVKVKVPDYYKNEFGEDYVTLERKYFIEPKEVKEIFIYKDIEGGEKIKSNTGFVANAFEYILYNENDQIVFKGTEADYHFNSLRDKKYNL